MDIKGGNAIVTGGGTGIGRAVTLALADCGMNVLICGRRQEALDATAAASPDRIKTCVCDIGETEQIDRFFKTAVSLFDDLFLMVNNAGLGIFGAAESVTVEDWNNVMNVNARGTFLCAQRAFQWMKKTGGGRIVNIASVVARKGYTNQVSYTASKHAMLGLTKVLAGEGQEYGIRCSAVCPGGVATEMVTQARPDLDPDELIQPEDVARAVVYLATEPETCCTDCINLRRRGGLPFA